MSVLLFWFLMQEYREVKKYLINIVFLRDKLLTLADQDAINVACKGRILFLEQKYGCMTAEIMVDRLSKSKAVFQEQSELIADFHKANRSSSTFIQFIDIPKPWHNPRVEKGFLWWQYCRKTEVYATILSEMITEMTKMMSSPVEKRRFDFYFSLS